MVPIVAEIVALPSAYENRRLQLTSPAADTVAMLVALERQAAVLVTFCNGPYEYVPVAVICRVPPFGISHVSPDDLGVTEMDWSTGAWQFTVVDPDPPLLAAVIVTTLLAPARHITRPPETVATLALLEVQLAELVTFCGGP